MSYLYGFLGDDIPVAPDVNPAFLTPPPVTSVTDFAFNPTPLTVKLPSFAPPTFSTNQKLLIGASIATALLLTRGRR